MAKIGMDYEVVKKKVKHFSKLKAKNIDMQTNILNSLRNQCKLRDGEKALIELDKECGFDNNNHSVSRLGYSKCYEERFESIFRKK